MESIIELEALSVGYHLGKGQKKIIAEDINISLYSGELVCLLGPNGAGKSTLMRTISGMHTPLSGRVLLEGEPLHRISSRSLARKLSVVLTDRVDTGLLSAYEVIGLGRYPYTNWSGKLSQEDHDIINWAIDMTRSEELIQRPVHELSDGERQKIMMARALAQQPKVMVLDEVTAFLDLPRRVDFMQLLRKLARESDCAILLSSHDLDLALRTADQVWLLPKQGGEILSGAPEDLVLNGAFEKTFASEGVHFDRKAGSFSMHTPFGKTVKLKGNGELLMWTQKAIERQGMQVSNTDPLTLITVEVSNGYVQPRWKIEHKGQVSTFYNIREMILAITQL